MDLIAFQKLSLEELLGCPREVFDEHYWSQLLGYDEHDNHSPVLYRCIRGMRTWELMKVRPLPFMSQEAPPQFILVKSANGLWLVFASLAAHHRGEDGSASVMGL